ncbi:site-specific tyrosine recombinase XerD [Roseivivax sp. THAF40]|uniref:DUF6538 domain-containing protein n=1 Tax=Roseivivax sp. THAF40 TaxID=2587858 RepID=UPI0012692F3E|nr:DUF6538 domain-containing protein [Roseivivax sp. THAF40]QFT45495.1 site-specific tyrosine recombinase XerD [Roseivivax sp. THAF40]
MSITKRAGSDNYYVRYTVPLEQRASCGRAEIWRSLRTSDRRLAKRLAPQVLADILEEVAKANLPRAVQQEKRVPTRRELQVAAASVYQMKVEADLDERAHDTDFVRQSYKKGRYKRYARELRKALATGNMNYADADYWADHFAFDLAHDQVLQTEFEQLLTRAELEAAQRWAEHDRGRIGAEASDPLFREPESAHEPHRALPGIISPEDTGKRLTELYKEHERHFRETLKPDTLDQRGKSIELFVDFAGDRPANQFSKAVAREWRNKLRDWPQKAQQRSILKGLSFEEVISKAAELDIPKISDRTIARYLSDVSAFFEWLVYEGYVDRNPCQNLAPRVDRAIQTVHPLSPEQIEILFNSPLFLGCTGQNAKNITNTGRLLISDWRFWLPIMALFSGARQAELAQLDVLDISRADDVDFINISNNGIDADKSLKTSFSKRRIPIHSTLIELGFLDFVDDARSNEQIKLFPELKRDSRGAYSMVSKFFQKYYRNIQLKNNLKQVNFHSLRHNFTDALRDSFAEEQFKPLLGHSGRTTTGGYGEKEALGLPARQRMIETVYYTGFDSSLIPKYRERMRSGYN